MINNVKNGVLHLDNTTMDYVSFGSGRKTIVMLPGLGDGIRTVKNTALQFSLLYRILSKEYKVYAFSRINELPFGYTTRDMARDVILAMNKLNISSVFLIGVSQGGMIAQYMLLDYPKRIEKSVLAVTLSKPNATMNSVINKWIRLAQNSDYRQLMIDTAEKSYSEAYLKKHRRFFSMYGLLKAPSDFNRFIIQAHSCCAHDCYYSLKEIKTPVLVIGGGEDKIVGASASLEMAKEIKNSKLFIYTDLGHAAYEEAKDFNERILNFFKDEV